jgi:hypothetical protein
MIKNDSDVLAGAAEHHRQSLAIGNPAMATTPTARS